jgi:hypothetical protein
MTVGREEYLDHMTFWDNRPPMLCELFGPMVGLKDEWRDQGATEAELDMSAFEFREPGFASVPVNTGLRNPCPEELIEETDEYIIARDRYGRRAKLFKRKATIALPLDYPVANMDDWRSFEHHYEFDESRFAGDWEAAAMSAREAGRVVTVSIPGGFDEPRQLLGEEGLCVGFYEQPELVHAILNRVGDTAFRVLERVSATVPVDQLSVHEDMAGKSGSLAGPKQIEEFIAPYYRRIWEMLADRGARLFDQDSDGDMNGVIDAFLDAGLNVMHPLEPAANMDIVALREKYGTRLAFRGGLDKHVLRRGHAAIEAELEYKIPPMVASGGCVLSPDHRIPNGSPLEAYRFYHARAWAIMNRESGGP